MNLRHQMSERNENDTKLGVVSLVERTLLELLKSKRHAGSICSFIPTHPYTFYRNNHRQVG
jgi:hypothetical protein